MVKLPGHVVAQNCISFSNKNLNFWAVRYTGVQAFPFDGEPILEIVTATLWSITILENRVTHLFSCFDWRREPLLFHLRALQFLPYTLRETRRRKKQQRAQKSG
jgi:hypothetical protein